MKRTTLFALIAAAVIAALAIFFVMQQGDDSTASSAESPATDAAAENSGQSGAAGADTVAMDELLAPGPVPDQVLGNADAPITIVEYASLSCSHCADFHKNTLPEVKKRYIDTGKVRLIFRDFPLDQYATAGAMLARCAGEGKYFPIVDAFFSQQEGLLNAQDPFQWLQNFGKQVGFTQESLEACLSNQELMDNLMAVRQRASEKFGVSSTPTFFFNGKVKRGGMTIEEFEKEIEPLVKS